MAQKSRRLHIDFLRIAAILLVLYNHSGERGFMRFAVTQGFASAAYMFLAVLDKIAVPLFFMISGALLLHKEEPLGEVIKRRVGKYALVLVGASLVSYLYENRGQPLSAGAFLTTLYTSEHAVAYWYLYAYLAFLLLLPFLRRLAAAMSERDFAYATALMGLISLLRIVELFAFDARETVNGNFTLFVTTRVIYYPLAGYFVEHRLKAPGKNQRIALGAAGVMGVLASCALLDRAHAVTGEWIDRYFSVLIYVPAIAAYALAKAAFDRWQPPKRAQRAITALGSCTFGVFLFEKIYRSVASRVFFALEPFVGTYPACLAWIVCAFLLGTSVTAAGKAALSRAGKHGPGRRL